MSSQGENTIIKNTQQGFQNKRLCLTNLLDFHNNVCNIYYGTKAVAVIDLNSQKTFISVPQKILLIKGLHGITGKVLKCLKEYFFDRKQRTVIISKLGRDLLVIFLLS